MFKTLQGLVHASDSPLIVFAIFCNSPGSLFVSDFSCRKRAMPSREYVPVRFFQIRCFRSYRRFCRVFLCTSPRVSRAHGRIGAFISLPTARLEEVWRGISLNFKKNFL